MLPVAFRGGDRRYRIPEGYILGFPQVLARASPLGARAFVLNTDLLSAFAFGSEQHARYAK